MHIQPATEPDAAPQRQVWLLQHIDPERNAKRYYYISIQPTLLDAGDGVSVVRCYGRIGGARQFALPIQCDGQEEALRVVRRLLRQRFNNGYVLVAGEMPPALAEEEQRHNA